MLNPLHSEKPSTDSSRMPGSKCSEALARAVAEESALVITTAVSESFSHEKKKIILR
jgi:hypothetical protein